MIGLQTVLVFLTHLEIFLEKAFVLAESVVALHPRFSNFLQHRLKNKETWKL